MYIIYRLEIITFLITQKNYNADFRIISYFFIPFIKRHFIGLIKQVMITLLKKNRIN